MNYPNKVCAKGFVHNNDTCLDFDECIKNSSSKLSEGYIACGHGAFCSNKVGGFACLCRNGFKTETGIPEKSETISAHWNAIREVTYCVDLDECFDQYVCPEKAKCQNTEGSYTCKCFDGFEGDNCADIDECNSTTSCDVNAKCRNINGGYECRCKESYYGTGDSCFPGRCLDANCPHNQKCVSANTINCECKPGFQFNSFSDCVDIDECQEIKCDDRTECSNTIGTYICIELHNSTTASTYTISASTELSTTKTILTSVETTLLTKRPIPTTFL